MSSHQSFQLPRRWRIVLLIAFLLWVIQTIWTLSGIFVSFTSKPKLPDDFSQLYQVLARKSFLLAPGQCELGSFNYPVDHPITRSESIILVCGKDISGRVVSNFP